MDFVRSNDLSWKYQRFTSSGCKDIGIRKFEFVAKTQFLYLLFSLALFNRLSYDLKHAL